MAESAIRAVIAALKRELESGTPLVTVPQDHPPGEEARVDFGEASVWIAGDFTPVESFHLRLSHSAKAVHDAFASEGQEALLEGAATIGVPSTAIAPSVVYSGRHRQRCDRGGSLGRVEQTVTQRHDGVTPLLPVLGIMADRWACRLPGASW